MSIEIPPEAHYFQLQKNSPDGWERCTMTGTSGKEEKHWPASWFNEQFIYDNWEEGVYRATFTGRDRRRNKTVTPNFRIGSEAADGNAKSQNSHVPNAFGQKIHVSDELAIFEYTSNKALSYAELQAARVEKSFQLQLEGERERTKRELAASEARTEQQRLQLEHERTRLREESEARERRYQRDAEERERRADQQRQQDREYMANLLQQQQGQSQTMLQFVSQVNAQAQQQQAMQQMMEVIRDGDYEDGNELMEKLAPWGSLIQELGLDQVFGALAEKIQPGILQKQQEIEAAADAADAAAEAAAAATNAH